MPFIPNCQRYDGGTDHGIFGTRRPIISTAKRLRPCLSQLIKTRAFPNDVLNGADFIKVVLVMGRCFDPHKTKSVRSGMSIRKQTNNGIVVG